MRELDVILTTYYEQHYATSCEPDKEAFRELLALPDPDLNQYLLGTSTPADTALAHAVTLVLGKAPS